MTPQGDLAHRRELLATLLAAQEAEKKCEALSEQLAALSSQSRTDAEERLALEQKVREMQGSRIYRVVRVAVQAIRQPASLLEWPGKFSRVLTRIFSKKTSQPESARTKTAIAALKGAECEVSAQDVSVLPGTVTDIPKANDIPRNLKELRIGLIGDRFTAESIAHECEVVFLHPDRWNEQMVGATPHLVIVESAWKGPDGEWAGKLIPPGNDVRNLLASCRAAGIPTVFWNKEDPLHLENFLPLASLVDMVLTTDVDVVLDYRQRLGHNRIGVWPFAVQPRLHHPIVADHEQRIEGSFFAGAWYPHFPERCRDFDALATALKLAGPFVIHDRNAEDGVIGYPQRYASHVGGAVPYARTGQLYRSYRIGLTINTIKHSGSMFARRAIELACSNTSVYSNHCRGLSNLMGQLVRMSDDAGQVLEWAWDELNAPDADAHRFRRLMALRHVLAEHTWKRRLEWLADRVLGLQVADTDHPLSVICRVHTQAELERVLSMWGDQSLQALLHLHAPSNLELPANVRRIDEENLLLRISNRFDGHLVAVWVPVDTYGRHYLQDLVAAQQFGQGEIIGKACYIEQRNGISHCINAGMEYRHVQSLSWRSCIAPWSAWTVSLGEVLDKAETGLFEGPGLVSIDKESYVRTGHQESPQSVLDTGIGVSALQTFSDDVLERVSEGDGRVCGSNLYALFDPVLFPAGFSMQPKNGSLELVGKLPEGREDAVFSNQFDASVLHAGRARTMIRLQADAHPAWDCYLDGFDQSGNVVSRVQLHPGSTAHLEIESAITHYRLAIAIRGRFVAYWRGLFLGANLPRPLCMPGHNRVLVVTNAYPRAGDFYRNAFVHRRVNAYQNAGVGVDVVCVNSRVPPTSYVFDGVNVEVCDAAKLEATLRFSHHRALAVHFMDREIWQAIRGNLDERPVVIWLHGSEIQAWFRRPFNYTTDEQRSAAALEWQRVKAFWAGVFKDAPASLRFVFVSHGFSKEVREDIGCLPEPNRWTVLPNPVDSEVFSYVPKNPEQRFNILSIRPHASRIYANDLVARVVEKLAESVEFESLNFTFVGDGPLWDEDFRDLAKYPNVKLVRKFVPQVEIARLHRQHGIFLVPTRGDTQGVSRDEAMASGLVPVTNDVGSVGEFVDASNSILCGSEDIEAMASGLLGLIRSPSSFIELSKAAHIEASKRSHLVISKSELELLGINI